MNVAEVRPIYLIEDDDAVRGSTRLLLETMGYIVGEYASAEDFLKVTEGREAACLVIDFHMQKMNGLELLADLRARGVATPAIIVTANSNLAESAVARSGALVVLHKPPETAELLEWIEQACRHRS